MEKSNKDTKTPSNKELLKAFLLEGNMVNWQMAEAPKTIDKPFYIRSLPQRIKELDEEFQDAGIGYISAEGKFPPRRTDYRLVRYTKEDAVNKDTLNEN